MLLLHILEMSNILMGMLDILSIFGNVKKVAN